MKETNLLAGFPGIHPELIILCTCYSHRKVFFLVVNFCEAEASHKLG